MTLEVHGAAHGRARLGDRVSFRRLAAVLGFVLPLSAVYAQSTPEDEYKKLITVSQDIQPLGDTPFGEHIGLYDGSLSFEQVDVSVPGTGPLISVGRVFTLHSMNERPDLQNRAFGDWDIDLPEITTTTANQNNVKGWVIDSDNAPKAICTHFGRPPSVAAPGGDSARADWEPASWWQGYQLKVPGQGSQELLYRAAGNTATPGVLGVSYPIVTKQNWSVGCLPQASNDATSEAFVAVSPDGTKYYLDHLYYRYMPTVSRPLNSGPESLALRSDAVLSPQASPSDILVRREGHMLVSRIEDRFGNSVSYTYSGDQVTDITGSDGRHVTIAYQSGTPYVSSVTIQGGAAGTRTWNYVYTKPSLTTELSSVTQPDGSTWTFNLNAFQSAWVSMAGSPGTCDALGNLHAYPSYTGSMTHPSGLAGSFTVVPTRRGRSYVPQECMTGINGQTNPIAPGTYASIPNASYSMAITQRQLSGTGIGTQTWSYTYSPSNESWTQNCAGGCATTVWTKVLYPDSHAERSTFSNRYDYTESLLLAEEVFNGDADVSVLRKRTDYGYLNPNPAADARAGGYTHPWGYGEASRVNTAQQNEKFPSSSQVISQDGDQYTWYALSFDAFARPAEVQRYNTVGYGVQERTSFQDDYAHWVLGLPLQSDNVTTGETVSRNVYDPNSLTLSERYRFGRKVMSYTFNAQGQLASFTDGNGHLTELQNYYRGIPRAIHYPDNTWQTLAVDDLDQITAISNQNGDITDYSYDEIGRLQRIDYPVGDTVGWNSKYFAYDIAPAADRNIGSPHWRRTVTQGGNVEISYYDVMMRPIINDHYGTDNSGYRSVRTDYDWKGRKAFTSYWYDGAPLPSDMNHGVATTYDVLGLPSGTRQFSELGDLTTSTVYAHGAGKQVTDAKGHVTLTTYQAFDQPAYDSVVQVSAPEGVVQTIARDVYGDPLSITQGGAGQSITKTMTYDSEHRLCRTWEPESGSEIMAYDNADNLAWSTAGASFNGAGCGQDQVADTAKTVRAYDAMNRVISVIYPSGTDPSTFTYDALGNPATATSGGTSWTYGRNKLGLLTTEALSVDGWNWPLGYTYDNNGALSSVTYPDGEVVPYSPDAQGRPTVVGNYITAIATYPDGDLQFYRMGSGSTYLAEKNGRNTLGSFTYGNGSSPVLTEDYTYDANGNVGQITDVTGNNQRTKVMAYDGLDRLVSATASNLWGTESYTYDTLNNIRSLTNANGTNTYNYDGANLLATITNNGAQVHAFQYDARGNTMVKDGQALNFDQANRLVSMPNKGSYIYDAAGRRVKKVTPSATTYYAYNRAGQLMWDYDAGTTRGTDYIYLGKRLIVTSKAPTTKIIGNVEGVTGTTNAVLNGWACSTGLATSIDVNLYVGGQGGTQTFLSTSHANVASEPAVQVACHASGTAYRFSIPLTEANREQYAGQALYVYGLSTVGGDSPLLPGSGSFNMPPSILAPNPPASATTAVSADLSTLTVSWATSPNTTSYTVERSWNGEPWPIIYSGPLTTVSLPIAVDGSYVFRVHACNANGCSNPTASNTVSVAHIPAAVASISVPPSSTGSVAISWPAVAWASSYAIEHSQDGTWTQIYAGAAASATINEPASGNWYYRVRACNANGCGGYATSTYVPVILPPVTPPTLNGGGTSNSGSYGLNWSGSPGATVYNLLENVNGAGWTSIQYGGSQSWSTAGKADGTYYYMVQGCNGSGCTGWSNEIAVTVANIPPVPSQPRWSESGTINKPVLKITWLAQPYATRYELMQNNVLVYSGTALFYSSLQTPGRELAYVVRACNAVGCSAWSMAENVIP